MSTSASLRFIAPLERALFLKSLGPLENMTPGQIAVFAEHAAERSFREGDRIFRSGHPLSSYHMVVEGAVHAEGGEFLDGRTVGPREGFGFLSMLAQRADGLDAVALEDTVTLQFHEDVFLDILEDDFSITYGLIRRLAKQTLVHRLEIPNGAYLAPREGELRVTGDQIDLVERIVLLRAPGSPWARASLEGITRIARFTPTMTFPAGKTLWKTGDRGEHTFVIVSGTVSCTTQWGLSRFRAGPGYPLGNLERLAAEPRWYTAVTETPLVALRSDVEPLLDVLEDHFDMSLGLVRAMAERRIRIQEENAEAGRADAIAERESAA